MLYFERRVFVRLCSIFTILPLIFFLLPKWCFNEMWKKVLVYFIKTYFLLRTLLSTSGRKHDKHCETIKVSICPNNNDFSSRQMNHNSYCLLKQNHHDTCDVFNRNRLNTRPSTRLLSRQTIRPKEKWQKFILC